MGEPYNRIYVKGLSPSVTEDDLRVLFRECGKILSIKTTPSSDFAFVEFENSADAEEAVKGFNGFVYNDKRLLVELAQVKSEDEVEEAERNERGGAMSPRSPEHMRRGRSPGDDGRDRRGQGDGREFIDGRKPAYDSSSVGCYNCKQIGHFARDCKEKPRNPNYLDTRGTKVRSTTRPASSSRADPYRRSAAPSTHTTDYRDPRDPYGRPADFGGYRRPPTEYRGVPERDRLGGGRRSSRDGWDDREIDLREEVNRRAVGGGGDPYMSMRLPREYGPMDDYAFYQARDRYDGMDAYMRGDFAPEMRFPRQGRMYDAPGPGYYRDMDPRLRDIDPRARDMDPRLEFDLRARDMDPRARDMDPRARDIDPRARDIDLRGRDRNFPFY